MNYIELTINGVDYKLTLNMANMIALEKKLGTNPLNKLIELQQNKMPDFDFLTTILYYSFKKYQTKISVNEVYDIVDLYLAEGNDIGALIQLIMSVFEVSGYFRQPEAKEEE